MKLWEKIEIITPYPAAYIRELDAIVIADLHLGYEGIMAEQGIFVPKVQFEQEMRTLKSILEQKDASTIIVCGDVKHEFSETSYHEFVEVSDFLGFLGERFDEVLVLKGNHDNYLIRITRKHGAKLFDELEMDDFYFLHGHRAPPSLSKSRSGYVVMGHEHPSIALFDEVGTKEKVDCFLYGRMKDKRLLVLPAFSTLAGGSEVNLIPREELLSPVLREMTNIDELKAVGISVEVGCLPLPELWKLKV